MKSIYRVVRQPCDFSLLLPLPQTACPPLSLISTFPAMSEIPSKEYLDMANQAYVVAYVTAACATTLLYDYALTLREEITRMWTLRFSIIKCLFLINRYVVIPMLVFNGIASTRTHLPEDVSSTLETCFFTTLNTVVSSVSFTYVGSLCTTVTHATTEGILLSRVWALYRGNTPVLVLACCFYLCGVATLVGLTIRDFVGEKVHIVQDFSMLPGCYAASVPALIAGYWIAPVIIESLLFVLVMSRAVAWWKDRWAAPPTLTLMARDSAVYFSIIFALLIVNLFVFEYAPPFLSSLFVTPSNTAGCIAGSRLLLNLRSLSYPSRTEIEMTDMSTSLQFTGIPRPGTNVGGPEFLSTTYSIDAHADQGHSAEIEGDNSS
ncbi:hypothetical protein BJ322DRAFT_863834 [Thelephora terrestris]|uniref:DUF6533 domain-containing protein n=1 Tax=Thelephora terrestris TaxID=56493 RepID=A0A9P6HDK0_9AGAM|nr:hypothetical protein BJ322DRAFT_863834 [Thelephora terrestris]